MLESERVPGMSGLREIGWIETNTSSINRCELVVERQDTIYIDAHSCFQMSDTLERKCD